jgi:Na+/proline symporter
MSYSLSKIRWRRVLGAAFAVIALSFLILIVITTVYAFVLAFQARGAPDQTAISRFAASVSPKSMPWLEMVLTLLLAFRVARKTEGAGMISGLIVGILAGLLSLAVTLAFGGRLGLHNSLFLLIVVALGWLGGFIGQRR